MSTKFFKLGLSEKNMYLPKQEMWYLHPRPKQEKNGSFMFWLELNFEFWRYHDIPCVLESAIVKVTWSELSSFSKIIRHIDNSIFKYTLQLKILQTWIKIKTWINIMKQKLTTVPGKLSNTEKSEPLHQNRWHFICFYMFFFSLKQMYFLDLTQCL